MAPNIYSDTIIYNTCDIEKNVMYRILMWLAWAIKLHNYRAIFATSFILIITSIIISRYLLKNLCSAPLLKFKETKVGVFLKEKAPSILDTVGEFLPDQGGLGIVKNLITSDNTIEPNDPGYEFNRNLRYLSQLSYNSSSRIATVRSDKVHNLKENNQIIVRGVTTDTNTDGLFDREFNGTFKIMQVADLHFGNGITDTCYDLTDTEKLYNCNMNK